jgi:hypothetical protein
MDRQIVGDDVPRMALRLTAIDWDGTSTIGIVTGLTTDGREVRAALGGGTLPVIAAGLAAGETVEIVVESWQVIPD